MINKKDLENLEYQPNKFICNRKYFKQHHWWILETRGDIIGICFCLPLLQGSKRNILLAGYRSYAHVLVATGQTNTWFLPFCSCNKRWRFCILTIIHILGNCTQRWRQFGCWALKWWINFYVLGFRFCRWFILHWSHCSTYSSLSCVHIYSLINEFPLCIRQSPVLSGSFFLFGEVDDEPMNIKSKHNKFREL